MIASLKGILDSAGNDWAVVDVGGVGYLVFCSARTLTKLPKRGEAVRLLTVTHVREDHIHLYGFLESAERDWFGLLTTVQGVGARMAMAILSVLSPAQLVQAIAAQDKAAISRANGVGPKLAARIASELKEKAGRIMLGEVAHAAASLEGDDTPARPVPEDAVSALVNLGYGRSEAFGAVAQAARQLGDKAPLEDVIRAGLRELAS